MDVLDKLTILTDAAKYDAACTSSGGNRGSKVGYVGNTSSSVAGCCHSFSADGRLSLIHISHFIRAVVLEQSVLAHLRLVISCVANHEEQFRKAMGAKQKAEARKELAAKRRQATQAERRIEELDRLFKRIYEDNANGKLSDSRFQMLSDDYEQEQKELREKLLQLNEEITQQEEQAENIEMCIRDRL